MGIMYKLLRHKDLSIDLTKAKRQKKHSTTIEEKIIDSLVQAEGNDCEMAESCSDDKQFTAEHILQLCKFLAEKSRKNKNELKSQAAQECNAYLNATYEHDHYNTTEVNNETMEISRTRQQTAVDAHEFSYHLPSESTSGYADAINCNSTFNAQQPIKLKLKKLTPLKQKSDINAALLHHNSNDSDYHQEVDHHYHRQCKQQGKRDMLLMKIRHQIFERKRQRQLDAHVQQDFGVWRPW